MSHYFNNKFYRISWKDAPEFLKKRVQYIKTNNPLPEEMQKHFIDRAIEREVPNEMIEKFFSLDFKYRFIDAVIINKKSLKFFGLTYAFIYKGTEYKIGTFAKPGYSDFIKTVYKSKKEFATDPDAMMLINDINNVNKGLMIESLKI